MSLKVVIDTNIIVSAVLNEDSVPFQAFWLARSKGTILLSASTFDELKEVLGRDKFDRFVSSEKRLLFLKTYLDQAESINPSITITACRDEKDNIFLELAVSGEATHIVTDDDDLLVLHPFEDIVIVTPAAFLENFSEENDDED